MKYRIGDIVIVTKPGIHKDNKAKVTEVNPLQIPNTEYYTVELYTKQIRIIVNEEDLKPWELFGKLVPEKSKCDCGGDFLSIPHHYNWCAKGGNSEKNSKDKDR